MARAMWLHASLAIITIGSLGCADHNTTAPGAQLQRSKSSGAEASVDPDHSDHCPDAGGGPDRARPIRSVGERGGEHARQTEHPVHHGR